MMIDIHTHPPRCRDRVPHGAQSDAPPWRPDQTVNVANTWADYEQAMAVADYSIAFNIATIHERNPDEPRTNYVGSF